MENTWLMSNFVFTIIKYLTTKREKWKKYKDFKKMIVVKYLMVVRIRLLSEEEVFSLINCDMTGLVGKRRERTAEFVYNFPFFLISFYFSLI